MKLKIQHNVDIFIKKDFLFEKCLKFDLDLRISKDFYLLSNYGSPPLVTEVTSCDVYQLWLTPTLIYIK